MKQLLLISLFLTFFCASGLSIRPAAAQTAQLAQVIITNPTPPPSPSPSPSPSASGVLRVPRPVNVPAVEIGNVISAVFGLLLIIAAILTFLFLLLGGIQWITSGGDKAGMEAARNKITNAIVGLIIVASAWAIMLLVGQFVGINLLGGEEVLLPTMKNPAPVLPTPSPTPTISPTPVASPF